MKVQCSALLPLSAHSVIPLKLSGIWFPSGNRTVFCSCQFLADHYEDHRDSTEHLFLNHTKKKFSPLVLGIKPRALCTLGKHTIIQLYPRPTQNFITTSFYHYIDTMYICFKRTSHNVNAFFRSQNVA